VAVESLHGSVINDPAVRVSEGGILKVTLAVAEEEQPVDRFEMV
jgi:hypothetical protein